MQKNTFNEIETLVRARYPVIYVLTWEERRAIEMVSAVAKKRAKKVFEWSFTTGMIPGGASQGGKAMNPSTKDPVVALDYVMDFVDPAIFVFKDFHPFLQRGNFAVVRRLREVADNLRNSYKSIVMVSPVLDVPMELEKDITVVDFPLPAVTDFEELLKRIIDEIGDKSQVKVDLNAESREQLLKAALGLTMTEAENVFAKILVNDGKLSVEDIPVVFSEKQQIIRKSGILEYYETKESFAGVGGLGNLKEWLVKRGVAFSDKAHAFGLPPPKGLLLLGVQGCGKSLCAKAVSSLWNMPLLRFDVGKVFGSLVGSSEENVRKAIMTAESVAPTVLWVDEIDKAFAGSRGSGMTDGGTTSRVFSTFLTWLSEKSKPVFVMATANDISQLPPELLRKGRFDEIFFVDLPAKDERREIFKIHLLKRGRKPEKFDLESLAEHSMGFSGAEIEEAVISALYSAFYKGCELETQHLVESVTESVPLSKTMEEQLGELRRWAQGRARGASPVEVSAEKHRRKIEL